MKSFAGSFLAFRVLVRSQQCMDAVQDPTPQTVDDCQAACCADVACLAYQFTESDPITFSPSCIRGLCAQPEDCSATACDWTGETGKTGGGAPAKPPPGQPGGDHKAAPGGESAACSCVRTQLTLTQRRLAG